MGNINFLNVSSVSSLAPMSGVSNTNREKDSTPGYMKICAPKIKYKKVNASDKRMAFGVYPEDYVYEVSINKPTEMNIYIKAPLLGITGGIGQSAKNNDSNVIKKYYFNNCYELEDIQSPERYSGWGTETMRSLLEMSIQDKDTNGRIIVNAKVTDGETSPVGFFYKLGFRFTDKNLNSQMDDWLRTSPHSCISPMITGMMYLPKENVSKLLMYKCLM